MSIIKITAGTVDQRFGNKETHVGWIKKSLT